MDHIVFTPEPGRNDRARYWLNLRRYAGGVTLLLAAVVCLALPRQSAAAPCPVTILGSWGIGDATWGPLVQAADGNYYALSLLLDAKGIESTGIVKISTTGSFSALCTFGGGNNPVNPGCVIDGTDHALYGTTSYDGLYGRGTAYRVTYGGQLTTLHDFSGGSDGANPSQLVSGTGGGFYGIAGNNLFAMATDGTMHTFYSFPPGTVISNLLSGSDGSLYGLIGAPLSGYLRIFKVAPDGTETTLCDISSYGDAPIFILGNDGNFYGTDSRFFTEPPESTVFSVSPGGQAKVLCKIAGYQGVSGFAQGADGALYLPAPGRIFRVSTTGSLAVIPVFSGKYGDYPNYLISGSDGYLRGITNPLWTTSLFQLAVPVATPLAVNDVAVLRGNRPIVVPVLANDVQDAGDALTIIHVSQPVLGSVTINHGSTITYTPSPYLDFEVLPLSDSFTYTVRDRRGRTSSATVAVQNPFWRMQGIYTGAVPVNEVSIRVSIDAVGNVAGAAVYVDPYYGRVLTPVRGSLNNDGVLQGWIGDGAGGAISYGIKMDIFEPTFSHVAPGIFSAGPPSVLTRIH